MFCFILQTKPISLRFKSTGTFLVNSAILQSVHRSHFERSNMQFKANSHLVQLLAYHEYC